MSECTHDCSSCGENCSSRDEIQKEKLHEGARVRKVIAVMSGKGGDLIVKTAKNVLQREYPALADTIQPVLPDENFRRVGQAVAAASLPE